MQHTKQMAITAILFALAATGYPHSREKVIHKDKDIQVVLDKAEIQLKLLKSVSYTYHIELLYKEEHYHNQLSILSYINFDGHNNIPACRFQMKGNSFFSCFNGADYFSLNETDKTIDIHKQPDSALFERQTALNSSFVTLRNFLPVLKQNGSIKKSISDTVINQQEYYAVKFELYDQYLGYLGKLEKFADEYTGNKTKPYVLMISKKTFLPFKFITKFKDREEDFIAVSFLDINTDPAPPNDSSWLYTTYTNEYSPLTPGKPLIAVGAVPDNWRLPLYTNVKTDSTTLYDYRGKIVMLDFWIKSCGPCLASFPYLNELQEKFGTDKLQILSINAEDGIEDIAFFYNKHTPLYKMLFEGKELAENYGVPAYPTVIILDKTGKIVYSNGLDRHAIENIIRQNL
ncbi:MAG: TlpA family protein disulfide reductase [Chitinophagaceae bacterium]|nr:TlpA family protein disulfide reductase [Chitinophagaceae bacterium]